MNRLYIALCLLLLSILSVVVLTLKSCECRSVVRKGFIRDATGHFDYADIRDSDMACIGRMQLRNLLLSDNPDLTDDGLYSLAQGASLEAIALRRTAVTDVGVEHIAQYGSLHRISLQLCNVTDAAIMALCKNELLSVIDVSNTHCTMSVPCLQQLHSLIEIWASDIPLSYSGMQVMSRCQSLHTLVLANNGVDSAMMCLLENHPNLEYLDVSGSVIANSSIRCLSTLPKLRVLVLDQCRFDGEAIQLLATLSRVEVIYLRETDLSLAHTQELARRMPSTRIMVK